MFYSIQDTNNDTLFGEKVFLTFCDTNTDIDECSKEANECNENAICVNTPGGYECLCKPGYERQGLICKRKDISNTK